MFKTLMLILGPVFAIGLGAILFVSGNGPAIAWTAAITSLCAIWWVTEPIPIPATSLIPLAVFPLAGILTPDQVAQSYGSSLVLLMLGGFVLSAGMEKSGAHLRIAVGMVRLFGGSSGRRLVFGFMAASALLSMWISNAATSLMLLPIVLAVIAQTEDRKLQIALLLGIAYSASVGGLGTPIGSPPNLIFMDAYRISTGIEPSFTEWMSWGLPVVAIMLPILGLWLTRGLSEIEPIELPAIGKVRFEEIATLAVFGLTAFFWMTRAQPFGGWSSLLDVPPEYLKDSSVALLGALLLFIIPSGEDNHKRLMDWETAKTIPWGILILFGGGICIATAFTQSGLSQQLGNQLAAFGAFPSLILVGLICLGVTFLTEITSNTATTTLLMPVLAAAAIGADMDLRILMVPATMSASFAFMLPVATPPNAIIFGAEQLTVQDMMREGFVLNLIGVCVITTVCLFLFQ